MSIDWISAAYHLPWLFGAALLVLSLSFADWQAKRDTLPLRTVLNQPEFQLLWAIGPALISLSLLLFSQMWWENLIWLAFLIIFSLQIWQVGQALWRNAPPR